MMIQSMVMMFQLFMRSIGNRICGHYCKLLTTMVVTKKLSRLGYDKKKQFSLYCVLELNNLKFCKFSILKTQKKDRQRFDRQRYEMKKPCNVLWNYKASAVDMSTWEASEQKLRIFYRRRAYTWTSSHSTFRVEGIRYLLVSLTPMITIPVRSKLVEFLLPTCETNVIRLSNYLCIVPDKYYLLTNKEPMPKAVLTQM